MFLNQVSIIVNSPTRFIKKNIFHYKEPV